MSNVQVLFQEAAGLNLEGVKCLSMDDCDGAYRRLKKGLQVMAKITALCATLEDSNDQDVPELSQTVPLPAFLNDGSYYVYNHALLFDPPFAPSKRSLAFYVSVLIFNMALVYHRRGHTKAMTLYEKVSVLLQDSLHAVRDSDDFLSSNCDDNVRMLQVLAQNNHCQMRSTMTGETQQAIDEWEALRVMMSSMEFSNVVVEDEAFSEIILNVLIPPSRCMAAAA